MVKDCSKRKGQGGDGQDRRPGPLESRQTSEEPGRNRKGDGTEDRHQLEGDVEGDDVAGHGGQGVGQGEVEGVQGNPS
jgi:hypothetical protein